MTPFDECWKIYPHYGSRSKKVLCKAIYKQITTKGLNTKVDGMTLTVEATPEEILNGCKAVAMSVIRDDTPEAGHFIAGFQTWLRAGRMFDVDGDELDKMVERWDYIQKRAAEDAQAKLRVVK